jgi:hypothetical protein
MKRQGFYPLPFPACAVELLAAARSVLYARDIVSLPELDALRLKRLEDAVIRFESEMPVRSDGEIFQIDPIPHEERAEL